MKFNDTLAVYLVTLIVLLWVIQGAQLIDAMAEVSGATIAAFTLIIQYYFRKGPPSNGGTP